MSDSNFTSTEYFQTLAEGKIVGSECKDCGAVHLPPRAICETCLSEKMAEVLFKGTGKLEAFSVIYLPPTAMINAGFGRENPNIAGIVKLSEGPMISAQILGLDPFKPEQIKIGTSLKSVFVKYGEKTFLAFEAE